MSPWNTVLALAATALFATLPLTAIEPAVSPATLEDDLLRDATAVFQRTTTRAAAAIPASLMMDARAIAVFPGAMRLGSRYTGRGVFSARGASPLYWTPPAVVAFQGAIPLDLESRDADFLLVARTPRGLDWLMQRRFASPVVLPIEPGALGGDTRIRTDAEMVAYLQFGDYLAGITVRDWSVSELTAANARLYGKPYSSEDIVDGNGFFHLPPSARAWRNAIRAYFRELS